MKVRIKACESKLRAMPWCKRRNWVIACTCIALLSILCGIGLIGWGDTASVLILMSVSLGSVRTNSLVEKLRLVSRDEMSAQITPERVLSTHLKSVLGFGLSILNAKGVALSLWDRDTGQRLDWSMRRDKEASTLEVTKPGAGLGPHWTGLDSAIYVRKGSAIECLGVNREGHPISRGKLLEYLRASCHRSSETLMLSYLEVRQRWHGTIAYLDAAAPSSLDTELFKLQQINDMAASALNSFQMISESVRTDERRRLARDLHDGVIQSLIATELQIALIERENAVAAGEIDGVLNYVREKLCGETRKLRERIEELQRGENSESLRSVFERLLKEFQQKSGITASFTCEMKDDPVPPRLAFDLRCLLEETLSNVRKHSGAKRVWIRLEIGKEVHLQLQDDGRGFDFCGRYKLSELQSMGGRPRTICERVQANGGDLILESSPGGGVRLEISLPLPSIGDLRHAGPYVVPPSSGAASKPVAPKKLPKSADAVRRVWRLS